MKGFQLRRLTFLCCLLAVPGAFAGSATWLLNPASTDWNTAANWTPASVPNGAGDVASFGVSNQPGVMLSADTEVNSIVYNAGASSFTTTVPTSRTLTIDGGITNSSGVVQNFVIDHGTLVFNSGVAGQPTNYNVEGGAQILFYNFAGAGFTTSFTLDGNGDSVAGLLQFSDNANATSVIVNLNGSGAGANCTFAGSSHAFFSTFNVNGADSATDQPGVLTFAQDLGGSESTNVMIANAGANGGAGGKIIYANSAGSFSSVAQVYGNGSLDISGDVAGVSLDYLEGDGLVFLGGRTLTCANESDDVFSGTIQNGGISGGIVGSVTKIDRGVLTLTGANTYSGVTTVTRLNPARVGTLQVSNSTASGTGTGPVYVDYGTLGGSGTIKGIVSIGSGGTGTNGFLAPAAGGRKALTLTIQSALTFKQDSAYNWLIQSKGQKARADRVNAKGITIESGAQFTFLADQLQSTLRLGSAYTVINNTSATPISGTFANLADGAVLNVNGNNFQANYEGGSGNDLTLTVVP